MPRFVVTMGREKVDTFSLAKDEILIGRSAARPTRTSSWTT